MLISYLIFSSFSFTECLKRFHPPHGKILCESIRFEQGSKCELKCNPGFIALDKMSTTCIFDEDLKDFIWDVEDERLQCVPAIGFLIGGIATNTKYLNEVEVFAPNIPCTSQPPPYPHKIVGTVSGFIGGQNIVCGGGIMEYIDCSKHKEGSTDCDTNIECVHTKGEARWCTGPKLKACYSIMYDQISLKEVRDYFLMTLYLLID